MKAFGLIAALFLLTAGSAHQVSAQETKVKWFGHAAFSITTPKGKVLLIDPWLSNPSNPEAKDGRDPLASVPKVDYILITHGHRDHVGDAVEIAKRTGATLVCNPELAGNLVKLADFPHVKRWFDAIDARPAVKRGLAVLTEHQVNYNAPMDPVRREMLFGKTQYERR